MATRLDVIELAYRRLGIKAEDEDLTADQAAYGGTMLDALYAQIEAEAAFDFGLNDVPDRALVPLANVLASDIGPAFGLIVEPRARPMMRLLATIRPDDRGRRDEAVYF